MKKVLFIGGTFNYNMNDSNVSSVIQKMINYLRCNYQIELDSYNGGTYEELKDIRNKIDNYDIVFWMANVPNELEKIRDLKSIAPKIILIGSKRNINEKYSFQELIQRALSQKLNLIMEFYKNQIDDIYNIRVFDPLGCVWYEGADIEKSIQQTFERSCFLKEIHRQPTYQSKINHLDIPNQNDFLEIVKESGNIFAKTIFGNVQTERFLGNSSFRCSKGFPSFKNDNFIFVSKRNVNKEYITKDDFVPVYMEDEKLFYVGNNKPSVDTPIQVRLYANLPNIKYMIHSHCYLKDVPFTKNILPCGAIEEAFEILTTIDEIYGNYLENSYQLNLKGHGSIIMGNTVDDLKNHGYISRPIPEY